MAKKNFDRLLNLDPSRVLEEVKAGNPALAARLVSEKLVEAGEPSVDAEPLPPLKLVVADGEPANAPVEETAATEPAPAIAIEPAPIAKESAPPSTTVRRAPARAPSPAPAKPQGRRGIITRADGREVARLFCYVEPKLYREVRVYCAQHDISISDLVNSVMADALRRKIASS